jgi:hypothetical protein
LLLVELEHALAIHSLLMPSRRKTLQAMATTAVALPILGQHQHDAPLSAKIPPYQAKIFSKEQLDLLAKLADIIIPATDTPGAAQAGVALLIDGSCSRNEALANAWKKALAWFAGQGSDHAATIARIAKEQGTEGARYFKLLKDTTIDHYYATREGLHQELGWDANTYLAEFKGCTHPEHQA